MNAKEYREKHHRCRTCAYSQSSKDTWTCSVKKTFHLGLVEETILAGIFCPAYEPEKEGE